MDDDLTTLLDALHWDQGLKDEEHISSLDACKKDPECRRTVEAQLGAGAFAGVQSSGELVQKLYQSSPELDLIELVRRRYEGDVAAGGYEPPARGD